jgi:ribonuclease HI
MAVPWLKMRFKDSVVLARSDDQGQLISEDGRVEIRYRVGDPRAYRAALRNLEPAGGELLPDDTCPPAEAVPERGGRATRPGKKRGGSATAAGTSPGGDAGEIPSIPGDTVIVYADGACSGNPGPAGLGIVLIDRNGRRELSAYLGEGTNNIAELTAIMLAADAIEDKRAPVRIHTDSQYAIGVLSKGWKAKANVALIEQVRAALEPFTDLELIYVRGHSGVVLNERADALAVQAVKTRQTTPWVTY